jgi:hypothetical protein
MERIAAIVLAGAFVTGCASWFMNGGKLVDEDYAPEVKAAYRIVGCRVLADGSAIPGPTGTVFMLVSDTDGAGLFERSDDGTGAVINNRWSDEKGDHYFGWVQSNGWEYVIPADPSAKPVRIVYSGLATTQEGTITKPASAPVATCELVPAT